MTDNSWAAHVAELALTSAPLEGKELTPIDRALIKLGLAVSVTALHPQAIAIAVDEVFAAGATPVQVQEIVSLVSGLGVHSLMVSAPTILAAAARHGFDVDSPLSEAEQALWDDKIGTDPFWGDMERELPGFLKAMLRLSPGQFTAFFDYCALPWKTRSVPAYVKELTAMACDATPSHRFLPGFRLHLFNAVKLGAGRAAILECIALADQLG